MLKNNYLSVAQFQLKLKILCNSNQDVLVADEEYFKQMENSIQIIKELTPDISIFPEMAYHEKYDLLFRDLSKEGKMIVFGSTYVDHMNKTKVYINGTLQEVVKRYPCGSEPMIRFMDKISTEEFITRYLKEHEFFIKNKKIYVLNCLEYYQAAYTIARNTKLSKNLFGFIVPCSNSNPIVFMEESKAIHNHNENIYSFVCNRVKEDGKKGYGKSYIFGPIQYHEKDWLKEEGIIAEAHNSSILTLDSSSSSYTFGYYAFSDCISRFGRSDNYLNTPINVTLKNLI